MTVPPEDITAAEYRGVRDRVAYVLAGGWFAPDGRGSGGPIYPELAEHYETAEKLIDAGLIDFEQAAKVLYTRT